MLQAYSELMDLLLQEYACERLVTPGTLEGYLGTVRLWQRLFPTLPLAEIEPRHVGEFFTWLLAQGRRAETVRRHRATLRLLLAFARRRRLTRIKLSRLPAIKKPRRQPRAWSLVEFERLLSAAGQLKGKVGPYATRHWFAALLLVSWSTGWRISTVMRIRTADVRLTDGAILGLETKGDEERRAELTPEAIAAVRTIFDPLRPELFGDWRYDRRGRQWKALNRRLRWLIRESGIPDLGRFHAIRKTGATAVAVKAGSIDAASRFCGHADWRVTSAHYVDASKLAGRGSPLPRLSIDSPQLRLF